MRELVVVEDVLLKRTVRRLWCDKAMAASSVHTSSREEVARSTNEEIAC